MFQSTPQRLFRPINSLGSFKIHQPLPLNPRDSKQLLNLLTTSFRHHLDREHGPSQPGAEAKATSNGQTSDTSSTLMKRRRLSNSKPDSRLPTDRHLNSILTNPLFSYGSAKATAETPDLRDPMDIFDEACARGFMKLEYAASCLRAKRRLITQSSVLSVRESMKESGAGLSVLKWLSATGQMKNGAFLQDRAFTTSLIEFLVAEDKQEVVWTWIEASFSRISPNVPLVKNKSEIELSVQLLGSLVRAQAMLGSVSLDMAYSSLARAKRCLEELGCPLHPVLSRVGCFLSHQSTVDVASHPPPSAASYDSFLGLVSAFTRYDALHLAHLHLHHPTSPDASFALKFLRDVEKKIANSAAHGHVYKNISEWRIISIGLDASRLLLETERYTDAKWAMDFLQTNFSKELGFSNRRQHDFDQAKAEAESLELLHSLNLA
jgi:hypothetical protein